MTTEELHLDNIQTGTEIVTIKPKNGEIQWGAIKVVGDYSELHKKWRLRFPGENKDSGLLPNDGKGYYAMHSRDVPHFYYSANPEHIRAAKESHEKARIKREREEQKTKEKLGEFEQKLADLLKEYGASIYAEQLSGDDQGVEIGICISIGKQSRQVDLS